ncbi:Regulator of G protein signaling domain-containing protein [Microdochium nivale]|nr:Regulator of G protein signaling domain-containing protein [Microdochium nivale]
MGLPSLKYRRPAYVDNHQFRMSLTSLDEKGSVRSGQSASSAGIPDALAFDKIINGGTCPPCTLRDFMNYLVYIEHSAENLQFFLWFRDYNERFLTADTSDITLAQEWTQEMEDETVVKLQKDAAERLRKEPAAAQIFQGTDFEKGHDATIENRDPFGTPPRSARSEDNQSFVSGNLSVASTQQTRASDAFKTAGVKQPFTIQPFRSEIVRVITTYIAEDAPRQLNLSARERKVLLTALAYTTHPSAFRAVVRTVENTLRRQAHPNFIRWTICNGNPARVFFARGLGVGVILFSTVAAVIITLSKAGRGYRAIPAIGFVIGISTLIAAWKGMCVVLHGMHHRHIKPWELFSEQHEEGELDRYKTSFESFSSSNSYEDEPWVVKYEKRNVVRKVFDREVWIQEPALRTIQDTIFVQAILASLLGAGILTAIFVAVPGGGYF